MANPQVENGYIKISNELHDALCKTRIPGEARQMLDVIIRKTYGFNKKEDKISTSQFMEATNLSRSAVQRARNKLKAMNIITVYQKEYTQGLTYSIQKNYDKWQVYTKKDTVYQNVYRVYTKTYTKCIPKRVPQKTIKNNIKNIYSAFCSIWAKYPNKVGKKQALRYFKASVKTEEDIVHINKALDKYLNSKRVRKGYIQNGSTWFNNWQDWLEYSEPGDKFKELL